MTSRAQSHVPTAAPSATPSGFRLLPSASRSLQIDPVATHSVYDFDIGDVVGTTPATLDIHLKAVTHQSLETDCAGTILEAALPGAACDGFLRVVGSHPEEGLVAMGVDGRLLHIVHLVDAS